MSRYLTHTVKEIDGQKRAFNVCVGWDATPVGTGYFIQVWRPDIEAADDKYMCNLGLLTPISKDKLKSIAKDWNVKLPDLIAQDRRTQRYFTNRYVTPADAPLVGQLQMTEMELLRAQGYEGDMTPGDLDHD